MSITLASVVLAPAVHTVDQRCACTHPLRCVHTSPPVRAYIPSVCSAPHHLGHRRALAEPVPPAGSRGLPAAQATSGFASPGQTPRDRRPACGCACAPPPDRPGPQPPPSRLLARLAPRFSVMRSQEAGWVSESDPVHIHRLSPAYSEGKAGEPCAVSARIQIPTRQILPRPPVQ